MLKNGRPSVALRASFGRPSGIFRDFLLIFAVAILPKNLNSCFCMGKLYHGALGRIKGSVGNTTYRRIYGKANESAVYDKVLEVANPKTANQILQRAKMAPAQKFYEAFKSVLDHSRQGIQAGEITRRAFMSEVMKKDFRKWKYVPKGFTGLIPSHYPVSKGSLPSVGFPDFQQTKYAGKEGVVFPGLRLTSFEPGDIVEDSDVISDALLKSNLNRLQEGDELTFLFVVSPADVSSSENIAYIDSLIIDTVNAPAMLSFFSRTANNDLVVIPQSVYGEDQYIVAAACIHSRKVGNSWIYSSETMRLEGDFDVAWGDSRAYREMMASYGAAGYNDANSRRILEQATNQQYNGNIGLGKYFYRYGEGQTADVSYLLSTTQVVSNGKVAQPIIAVFQLEGSLVGSDGQKVRVPGGGTSDFLSPADIGWAGPTVEWAANYIEQLPQGL